MKYQLISTTLLLALLFSSCSSLKHNAWLNDHNQKLRYAAYEEPDESVAMDILLESVVDMMDQSIAHVNVQKGAQFAEKYLRHNEREIDAILIKVDGYQREMSTIQKLAMLASLRKKSYAGQLLDLYPKFVRRYKQYDFLLGFSKKLKQKIGLSILDSILDKVLEQ